MEPTASKDWLNAPPQPGRAKFGTMVNPSVSHVLTSKSLLPGLTVTCRNARLSSEHAMQSFESASIAGSGTGPWNDMYSQGTSNANATTSQSPTRNDTSSAAPDSKAQDQSPLPSITLPKGGGAIHDIGEKFSVNAASGTGSMSVPITTSPGRSGFGPQLSLSYDSGSGNGSFGFGWHVSLPSITRKTDKGLPRYLDDEESDVFILAGSEDLVPVLSYQHGEWKRVERNAFSRGTEYRVMTYRPRIESVFARIERWTNICTGEIHWKSISKDNITTLYGEDNRSRIFDPFAMEDGHPTRIFTWLISSSFDDKGNAVVYEYKSED